MSIKEDLVETLMKNKIIEWIVKLIERSTTAEVHTFSLDFGSALLANILHANSTLDTLEKDHAFTKSVSCNPTHLIVNAKTTWTHQRDNSYFSINACSHMPFLLKQRKVLATSGTMPICGQNIGIRRIFLAEQYV